MKLFNRLKLDFTFVLVLVAFLGLVNVVTAAAVEFVDEIGDVDEYYQLNAREAPSPPIATDPSPSTAAVDVVDAVETDLAGNRHWPGGNFNGLSDSSTSSSSTATEPNHYSASPTPLFTSHTSRLSVSSTGVSSVSTTSESAASASKTSSATDGKSTGAAGAPTPMAEGLGALAAVVIWVVAIF